MPVDEFGREIPGAAFATRASSPSPPRRKRRTSSRSRSPPPPVVRHPSQRYVSEPLLCEYVWKRDSNKKDDETYEEYKQRYCLNYVRAFFNEHMDDSWFRNTYSPLELKRILVEEQERAAQEAALFQKEASNSPTDFCEKARLGGGSKQDRRLDVRESHVFGMADRIVALHDIPPHVTDQQLSQAVLDQLSSSKQKVKIFSASVSSTTKPPLIRRAYCLVDSATIRKELLDNLSKAHDDDHRQRSSSSSSQQQHIPRKDHMPKELDLHVDCSDPYGRLDVDEDGKGGGSGGRSVPHRKCTVAVSTMPISEATTVLSAAVSSANRIPRDKDAAILLARALDVSRSIPQSVRLDTILSSLGDGDLPVEDVLDVSIAYLRRVHLFSFYNGCSAAKHFGQVLAGQHATGTIHLRLKDADDILAKKQDEAAAPDLLVTRLDESISKALELSNDWVSAADTVLPPEQDALATELEQLEEQTKTDWTDNHALVDNDGRARCSFHFCRKLFKDDSFLKKHLIKKHGEFLKGEMAKCHDPFMMKAWDAEANRPVPPILVDCGSHFGMVPSPVVGVVPTAHDPEPDLCQKEEEKRQRKEEERMRREKDMRGGDEPLPPPRRGNFVDVDDMKEEKVELSFENVEVVEPPKKKRKKKKLL